MNRKIACILLIPLAVALFLLLTSRSSNSASKEPPPGCAGVKTCECCHQEIMADLQPTQMGRLFLQHPRTPTEGLVCETCHGPGQAHAESGGTSFEGLIAFSKNSLTPMSERNEACLKCHEKRNQLFWQGSPHAMRDVGCQSCHSVHKSVKEPLDHKLLTKETVSKTCEQCHKEAVAQQMRFSHHPVREGKMQCTDCHNPHGTTSEHMLKANTENELCYKCHAEYRGPLLYEHPPVREQCSNCHVPHGSNYPDLLKLPEMRLCRTCHPDVHHGNSPARGSYNVVGRMCTDCHFNIHGSNHPSGFALTR